MHFKLKWTLPTNKKQFREICSGLGKKNAKAARAGGVSLMALSLAACGSDDSTTTTSTSTTTTTTTTTPAASQSLALTIGADVLTGGAGDDRSLGVV